MGQPISDKKIPNTPFRFVLFAIRPHWRYATFALIAVTIAQILGSLSPYILKLLVDAALAGGERAEQVVNISWWSGVYVVMLGAMFLFWRISGFIGMEFISRSATTAYERLYEYISLHSHTYFSNRFAGSLSNKISNVADGTDRLLEGLLWQYGSGFLSLLISVALFATVDILFGALYTALIVAIIVLNIFLVRYRRPFVVASAAASSRFRGIGVDMLGNISAVRQFARREHEMHLIHESAKEKRIKNMRQWRISEMSLAINNAIIVIALAFIVGFAIMRFSQGLISVGDIVLVITLVFQTNGTLVFIGSTLNSIVRVYGEIQEGLLDVLEVHEIVDASSAQKLAVEKGGISFENVIFSYENQNVFSGLSLAIQPGERVGIVGTSGAGKTTFVSLLLRQHDIQGGSISIDGKNIAEVTQDSLREAMSVVPQDPQLFHRSIRENIAYGKLDANDDEVMQAAKMAYAEEFIVTLPNTFDTLVGERGVKLSGGQRQRVVIARAILKNAPILVLDEATSALDSASEVVIQKALHGLMEGKTVIAIAHRLSTLKEMDRIVVFDKGVVAESGTHEELLAQKGIYAGLWGHQVGGFIQEE